MKRRLNFTRFIVALTLAGIIGSQAPSAGNIAFAQSNQCGGGNNFASANVAGAVMGIVFAGALVYSLTAGRGDDNDDDQARISTPVDFGVRAVARN